LSRTAGVVTPEAVVVDLAEADIGSRLVARLIDAAAQLLGTGLLVGGFAALSATVPMPKWAAISAAIFVIFAGLFGYPVAMETLWRGRSLGKAAFGLRVVTVEGGPTRFRHATIRAALGVVELYATFGSLAVASAMVSRRHQRLGDLVAGTVVRRERTGAAMPEAVSFGVPAELESYAATIDASGLSVTEYAAVRNFLLRAATLDPNARIDLASRLAGPLAARVAHTIPAGVWPETFLLCLATTWQRHHQVGEGPATKVESGKAADAPAPATVPPEQPIADSTDGTGFAPLG